MPKELEDVKSRVVKAVESSTQPNIKKVIDLLNESEPVAVAVCKCLKEGLTCRKPLVFDGEISYEPDYLTRHKYAETILEVIGEKNSSGLALTVKNYVQIYRPEPYTVEEVESSSRATDRSI